jgi:hypothetical protein
MKKMKKRNTVYIHLIACLEHNSVRKNVITLKQKNIEHTLKPQYNDPFYNKIPAKKNLISSPSVVNSIVKSPTNNKIPAIKYKIFGPFRFVILRYPCITIS